MLRTRTPLAIALLLLATTTGAFAPPASADMSRGLSLQVLTELEPDTAGFFILTAQVNRSPEPAEGFLRVSFELESGSADNDGISYQTPDLGCAVPVGATECSTFPVKSVPGERVLVRGWIDVNMNPLIIDEIDMTEGRNAGPGDCTDRDQPGACEGTGVPGRGGDTASAVEPDITDVVEVNGVADAVNAPPTAQDDEAATDINRSVTVGVLANDTDPDGHPLSVLSYEQPAEGRVTDDGAGNLTYTPRRGFRGAETFGYVVSDGHGGSASALVRVVVSPPRQD